MVDFKSVRVMPPGTVNPAWEKVNIRGKVWPHTPSWKLVSAADFAAAPAGRIETVIDSGGWLAGLREVYIQGYVPGGWAVPTTVSLNFVSARYTVNGISQPLDTIFTPNPGWGIVDPACIVPGTGVTSPGGTFNFALAPTLAHIMVYLGMSAQVYFSCTGLGDLNLCFADETLRTFAVADGSDMRTARSQLVTPQGSVLVHLAQAPVTGTHEFDASMTLTSTQIRIDTNAWTSASYPLAAPEAMLVVGRIAGPLTVTRIVLATINAAPTAAALPDA